jgi:precorrin-6B C5,15-methyltransferase / cobalt-precorrin-6B C5,C15-methyltransferase
MAESIWQGKLAVVGVGLEGPAGMSPRGRRLLEAAQVVVGNPRHLELISSLNGRGRPWTGSTESLVAMLAGQDVTQTVLLATGDPNLFGIGATLIRLHGPGAVEVEPAVSSFQLALARAGVPAAGAAWLSAHGRSLAAAAGQALSARRAAILTDSTNHPGKVAEALKRAGVENLARLVVAERLGGADERVFEGTVAEPPPGPYDPLSVVVLDRAAATGPRVGRDEGEYEHRAGQITKAETRILALARLDLGREDVLWDIGAGSGSLAIEAGRLIGAGAVYAIERDPCRAAMMRRNLASYASWNVEVIEGEAADVVPGLPTPDAVFIGGGGAELPSLIETAVMALGSRPGVILGRLVVSLASLESMMDAVASCRRLGLKWNLCQLQVSRARAIGPRLGWKALNPVSILHAQVPRRKGS